MYQIHTVCSKDFQKKIALLRLVWAYFYKVQKCDHAWIYHILQNFFQILWSLLCAKKNWLVKIWYFSILFLPERLLLKRNYVAFLLNSKMHVPTNFLRMKIAFLQAKNNCSCCQCEIKPCQIHNGPTLSEEIRYDSREVTELEPKNSVPSQSNIFDLT